MDLIAQVSRIMLVFITAKMNFFKFVLVVKPLILISAGYCYYFYESNDSASSSTTMLPIFIYNMFILDFFSCRYHRKNATDNQVNMENFRWKEMKSPSALLLSDFMITCQVFRYSHRCIWFSSFFSLRF